MTTPDSTQMSTPDPPQMFTVPPPEKLRAVSTEVHHAAFITSVLGLQNVGGTSVSLPMGKLPLIGQRSPKSLLLEKPKDPFILPDFGFEIGDGESISLLPEPPKLAEIEDLELPLIRQRSPKSLPLEKPKDLFILPDFGFEIGDGESISLLPEPPELAEIEDLELPEAAFEDQPIGDGLRRREQLYSNLHKKRKRIGDGERPQSPDQAYLEAPGMSEAEFAVFHKQAREIFNALYEKRKNQIEGRGVESVTRPPKPPEMELIEGQRFEKQVVDLGGGVSKTREEIYAIFESKRKPFPRDEEWINEHYCCLKDPQLIDNPDVTEILEEHVKHTGIRSKPYTCLPRFRENLPFCEKLEAYAKEMVERFNTQKGENWCFDSVELVAAAPVRCYMLEFIVSKGALRMMMRGSVYDGAIKEVMDAGVIKDKEGCCC